MLLEKQNIAFHGHDEIESSFNRGKFFEIVQLIAKYYEPLETHFEKGQTNFQYASPTSQNAFTEMIAKHLQQRFVTELTEAKFYCIQLDSKRDINHYEHFFTCSTICVRVRWCSS